MRKKIPKRIIAILLLFTMILSSVPAYALEYNDNDIGVGNGSGIGNNVPGSTDGTYNWGDNKQGYRITILDSTGKPISNSVDFVFSAAPESGIRMYNSKVESLSTSKNGWIRVELDSTALTNMGIHGVSLDPFTDGHFPRAIISNDSGFHANGVKVKGFLLSGELTKGQTGREIVGTHSMGSPVTTPVSTSNTGLKNAEQLTTAQCGKDNNHS